MSQNLFVPILITILLAFASCQTNMETQMAEKRKAAFTSLMQIMDGGNVEELGNYIAEDMVDHSADPMMTNKKGLEGVKEIFTGYQKVFPNMNTTIHSMAVSGDTLFALITSNGTTAEPFMGMPANQQMSMNMVDVVRFEGDKIAEHWGFMDMNDAMKMMPQQNISSDMMNK
jgi:predicted ester cyclase